MNNEYLVVWIVKYMKNINKKNLIEGIKNNTIEINY